MGEFVVGLRDLGLPRPQIIRLMIGQVATVAEDWIQRDGLYFAKDVEKTRAVIEKFLEVARQQTVEVVVLPELSVPESCIGLLQAWSSETGGTVVGGSHYHNSERGYIARCPVIIRGDVVFTEKIIPAPIEVSPVPNEGIVGGQSVVVFHGTPVGNFGVLICSDYLDANMRQSVLKHDLDMLIVPAFQKDSQRYHTRMSADCDEAAKGVYLVYSNMVNDGLGDGRSAILGLMDAIFARKLKEANFTDGIPAHKLCELSPPLEYVVADIDLSNKRITIPRTVHTRPNVMMVSRGTTGASEHNTFVQLIAHDDERYRRIESLFVEPREYSAIKARLEESRLVFVIGDPGIGKTYTAAMLLKHYFSKGYVPMWYTGLEREERRVQRLTLERFEPKDKQVVYFEDPFGRLTFERRESLFSIFGPMTDRLKSIDARVIITSRKEIFERFLDESLSSSQLTPYAEEMNIIKPSYSKDALKSILWKLAADRCAWYGDPKCREAADQAIMRGTLTTPLVLRGLVYATENETRLPLLRSAIRRRGEEQTLEMAREIIACDPMTKAIFALVYLLGFRDQAYLIQVFDALVVSLNLADGMSPHPSFSQLLRSQLGYRLERSSSSRSGIRFVHPAYEDAVGAAGAEDSTMESLMTAIVEDLYKSDFTACMKAIGRHVKAHPRLCAQLYASLAEVVVAKADLHEMVIVGTMLVPLFKTMKEPQILAAIEQISRHPLLAQRVNQSINHSLIAESLRFVYNYDHWIGSEAGHLLASELDWDALFQQLRRNLSLHRLIEILEWSHLLAPARTTEFLKDITPSSLVRRSKPLSPSDHKRVARVLKGTTIYDELVKMSQREFGTAKAWRRLVGKTAATIPTVPAIVVDADLAKMLSKRRWSILPPGVIEVRGDFEAGDVISVLDPTGKRLSLAMAEYRSHDVRDIKGHHSSQIAEIIGKYCGPSITSRRLSVWERELAEQGQSKVPSAGPSLPGESESASSEK